VSLRPRLLSRIAEFARIAADAVHSRNRAAPSGVKWLQRPMSSYDKDHARMSYDEFCAFGYNYLFVELLRRGWTEKKLAKAYDSAIAAWQQDGFEG
jgi:hypothetical protein